MKATCPHVAWLGGGKRRVGAPGLQTGVTGAFPIEGHVPSRGVVWIGMEPPGGGTGPTEWKSGSFVIEGHVPSRGVGFKPES